MRYLFFILFSTSEILSSMSYTLLLNLHHLWSILFDFKVSISNFRLWIFFGDSIFLLNSTFMLLISFIIAIQCLSQFSQTSLNSYSFYGSWTYS